MKQLRLILPFLLAACESPTYARPVVATLDPGFGSAVITDGTYAGGCFIFADQFGRASRSCDRGESWQPLKTGLTDQIMSILDADGTVAAVAARGWLTVSGDLGDSWTVSRPHSRHLRSIAYGNGVWVIVGDEGLVLWSTDLKTWHDVSLPGPMWISVIYDGRRFVASGRGERIAWATDPRRWTVGGVELNNPLPDCAHALDCRDLDEITWTGTQYFAVTHPGVTVLGSPDLLSWTEADLPLADSEIGMWAIRSAGGLTVAGSAGGSLAVTSDGKRWERHNLGMQQIVGMAYGDSVWLVGGHGGQMRRWYPGTRKVPF